MTKWTTWEAFPEAAPRWQKGRQPSGPPGAEPAAASQGQRQAGRRGGDWGPRPGGSRVPPRNKERPIGRELAGARQELIGPWLTRRKRGGRSRQGRGQRHSAWRQPGGWGEGPLNPAGLRRERAVRGSSGCPRRLAVVKRHSVKASEGLACEGERWIRFACPWCVCLD